MRTKLQNTLKVPTYFPFPAHNRVKAFVRVAGRGSSLLPKSSRGITPLRERLHCHLTPCAVTFWPELPNLEPLMVSYQSWPRSLNYPRFRSTWGFPETTPSSCSAPPLSLTPLAQTVVSLGQRGKTPEGCVQQIVADRCHRFIPNPLSPLQLQATTKKNTKVHFLWPQNDKRKCEWRFNDLLAVSFFNSSQSLIIVNINFHSTSAGHSKHTHTHTHTHTHMGMCWVEPLEGDSTDTIPRSLLQRNGDGCWSFLFLGFVLQGTHSLCLAGSLSLWLNIVSARGYCIGNQKLQRGLTLKELNCGKLKGLKQS